MADDYRVLYFELLKQKFLDYLDKYAYQFFLLKRLEKSKIELQFFILLISLPPLLLLLLITRKNVSMATKVLKEEIKVFFHLNEEKMDQSLHRVKVYNELACLLTSEDFRYLFCWNFFDL